MLTDSHFLQVTCVSVLLASISPINLLQDSKLMVKVFGKVFSRLCIRINPILTLPLLRVPVISFVSFFNLATVLLLVGLFHSVGSLLGQDLYLVPTVALKFVYRAGTYQGYYLILLLLLTLSFWLRLSSILSRGGGWPLRRPSVFRSTSLRNFLCTTRGIYHPLYNTLAFGQLECSSKV